MRNNPETTAETIHNSVKANGTQEYGGELSVETVRCLKEYGHLVTVYRTRGTHGTTATVVYPAAEPQGELLVHPFSVRVDAYGDFEEDQN